MEMAFGDHVALLKEGHVAVITLNRPPHNFVSIEVMRYVADATEAANQDPEVRAILFQAEGKAFSAGADFSSRAPAPNGPGLASPSSLPLYRHATRLFAVETPIVAAVQGPAIGAGLGLALVADFRIASPEARFSANFVKLGFHAGFGISHLLPRLIGEQKASLMLLTGRRIKAEQALTWGLVDEVVDQEALRGAAMQLAQEIAENAPLAVQATRKTLRKQLAAEVLQATQLEDEIQIRLRGTEDFHEGVRAVAERRPGEFLGR